ncbi:MAG TPA: hypothetical protein VMC48_00640 [Methanobacterium sp.]|nr:hypothetical protein [Methanobacterium sp.]
MGKKINRFLEIIRWFGVALGVFLAFLISSDPVQQFNIFAIISVVFIAGCTALEGLFFSKTASEVSGYGEGGAYQRQSALHFLAIFLAMILVVFFSWGFLAYLGIYLVLLVFLTLSAINHLFTGLKEKFVMNTVLRPALVILLWAITLYFLLPAMK